jgi:hypothetical protein
MEIIPGTNGARYLIESHRPAAIIAEALMIARPDLRWRRQSGLFNFRLPGISYVGLSLQSILSLALAFAILFVASMIVS